MTRKTKRGKIAAKVLAAILSVTMGLSTLSTSAAGSVAFAQEAESLEVLTSELDAAEDTVSEETEEDDAVDAASEEAGNFGETAEPETEESEAETSEDVDAEASEEEAEASEEETEEVETVEEEDNISLESTDYENLVEFTTETSEADGIKTTVSKWDFATAKNTGKSTATGDTISGIVVGGGSGRVILDAGKDLNVKNNSTAETTGVIYLPIADDTNVVTINIKPMDKDISRYVTVGSFDSDVTLVDNGNDPASQTVTFKSDLVNYVVDSAVGVEGRYIPLYSHGNFKTAYIELIETDATTIVEVSGKLTGAGADKVTGLKFKNLETEESYECVVGKDNTYSISLPNEYQYAVSASGTLEYGIDETDNGNIVDLSVGNDKTKEQDFVLVPLDVVRISGTFDIEKIDNANPISSDKLKVTLVPKKNTLDNIEVPVTKTVLYNDFSYTFKNVALLPREEYSVKLTNANDYEVTEITIGDEAEELLVEEEGEEEGANNTINIDTSKENVAIKATGKPLHKVTLEAVTHNLKAVSTVKALTVKNLDDDYTYSFDKLSGSKLEIEVRDGLYEVTEITSTGSYEPYEHFEVEGEDESEKMYLRDTSEKKAVSYKSEVTVGKNSCDYTTIYDALDAIGRMDRGDKRVTVVLKDEYYQEQVVVDEPNITFTSRRSEGSTISWYYGLGGDAYYSAYLNTEIDKNHLFYDEAHAVDQYESTTIGQTPGNWGSTVNLKSTATGFRAENITFENSFNFYISEVEKDDIAVSGNILDRKAEGADPTLYKSKERACTMYNRGADNIEFYNCSFISSQDTLYTGDKDEYSYYYNCLIEGTTDFICGDGNAVFDNCELVLYGFSDQSKSDLVILASKGSASKGYLFNYCTVSLDTRDGIMPTTSAYLGRPWGTSDEKVAFMNTILESDVIQEKGWTTMNTVPSLNLGLHEYRTRLMDGTKVDLSGRVATNIGSDKQGTADNYVLEDEVGYTRADYMSVDWTPSYYGADYADVCEQILRYNALVDSEAYAQADAKKKAAVEKAYNAIVPGLFVKDQSQVDTFAANLEKAIDDIKGKDVDAPVSSLKSGTYTLSRVASLTTKTEGASIYYTTDGTDPSYEVTKDEEGNDVVVSNGTLYTAPVVITDSLTLKAIAVAEGSYVSEISVYNYVIEDPSAGGSGGTYVLESSALTPFAQGAKADGDSEKAGTDNYFTVIYSAKTKVDSSNKSWEDGYSSGQRINFGGIASTEKNSVMFKTGAAATVKVWWAQGGDDSRQITILDSEGNAVATTTGTWTKNTAYISELAVADAGTYYLGSAINNNYIFKVEVVEESSATSTEYDLQTKDLTAFAQGAKADGASEKAGTDEYFTVIYSAKSKVDSSNKTWEDGYSSGQRINFGGTVSTAMNAVSFTTQGPATVDIWWAAGDAGRQMGIISASGEDVAVTDVASTKNTAYKSTLEVSDAGTYYLGSKGGNNYLFRIYVTETAGAPEKPDRGDWADVPAPFISDVQVDGGKINVTVQAFINYNGGDSLLVDMMDEKSDAVDTQRTAKAEDKMEKVLTFTPSASGSYSFIATLTREGEESKSSLESEVVTFALPLVKPNITAVTNKGKDSNGKGKLEVVWTKVNEAKKYDVEIVQIKEEEVLNEETGVKEKVKKETVLASAQGLTDREVVLGGLPIDEKVTVKVYAVRDEDRSEAATKEVTVTGNNDRTWSFSSYGSNASTGDSATVNADGSISIKTPSSTKIVPGSTDGLGYYYTKIDPSENFTLTAQFRVDSWPYDNGQEGMGLMVADAVGEHGDGAAFWNNSYMAAATQIQYNWDPTIKDADGNYVGGITNATSDSETIFQEKMRLGLGWIARDGVTQDQKRKAESGQVATPEGFTTNSGTFETSVASAVQSQLPGITSDSSADEVASAYKNFTIKTIGSNNAASYGQLNIIDASKASKTVAETVRQIGDVTFTDISKVRYQIQRNNTGYVLRYLSNDSLGNESDLDITYATDEDGNRISYVGTYGGMNVVAVDGKVYAVLSQKVIYDTNRNSLTQIDKKYIYLGMFSARKSSMTVEEYTLETVDPENDYPAEEREMEPVALNALVMSAETSNTAAYDLIFSANADGTLTIEMDGKVVAQEMAVTAGKWATVGTSLKLGDNKFNIVFTPTPGYAPGEYQYLVIDKDDPTATSKTLEYTVKYKALSGNIIYVAPGARGDGSKASPASIYDAVSYAAPGQTIYLAGGTYNLGRDNGGSNKNIRIERGTDGTAGKMIVMETDPEDIAAGRRAVLSFAGATGTGSAFMLTGNYWHLKNFDVTGSKNGEKGLHIAGKHNIVEMVNAYMNGNTGIEIAREGSVGRDLWPSDNLILNCTSYLNYDAGFEDADGFAAKITCGEGNRFVGCVSAYNADDGWDLFAKVQSGSIGSVTIEDSIAYKNGYLLGRGGKDYSVFVGPDAVEFEAGNGNGFKLGGDGMSGYHVLRNSYAFGNKANGIDSNSCPDIQVFNSVSYSNGTGIVLNNYAKAINSDYTVKGLISIGSSKTKNDSISMLGAQVASKIYNASNFFWNGSESVNAADDTVKATDRIFRSVDPAALGVNVANGKFVARDAAGNIEFNGFLQLKKSEDVEDAELKALLKFIEDNGIGASDEDVEGETAEFVVFAKEVNTLADVTAKDINGTTLPEGYRWADITKTTASYAGTTAEFDIVNSKTGKKSTATVSFVEVTGVVLDAATDITGGIYTNDDPKEAVLEASPVFVPDVVISEEAQSERFTYTFTDKNKMALNEAVNGNTVTLTRADASKEGYADYTATMQFTAGGITSRFTSNSISFRTRADRVHFTYAVSGATASMGNITVAKVGDKFKFTELKVEGVAGNDKVNVTVGDSKILKVSNGEYTARMSGTTYLTLTAAGDKTVQLVLMVKVQGRQFAVNVESITVDKAKNDGTSFAVTKLGDAEPGVLSVSKVLKGTTEKAALKDAFEVTKVIGNVYKISVKANADETVAPKIATGSYSVVLASGEEEFEPVNVIVKETKPIATLKQTRKVNLFYKAGSTDNTGAIKATSKLTSVTLKVSGDSDFNLAADGDQYQLIMTNAAQKKIESGAKLNRKLVLTESFDGYKKAYDKTVTYMVQTETRAPKYRLELDNSVLYTQLGIKDSEFRILNLETGEYLSDAQIKLASSKKSYVNANKNFTIDEEGGTYRISTTKNGTARISVVDPDFSKDPKTKYATDREVILNARLTINKNKPVVSIESAKINGQAEYAAYSEAAALITVRGALDYSIRDLYLEGNTKAAQEILPFIDYTFDRDELNQPVLMISFKDSADMTIEKAIRSGLIKKGSYSFNAYYSINKIEGMKTRFTLTVMTGAKATGKVKGRINLVARGNSYVSVTPNITKLGGTVTDMYFAGAENLFDVEWDSAAGLARVYATEDGSYRAEGKYRLTPVFVVATSNGVFEIAAAPVTIQTTQTKLNLTAKPVVQVKMSDVASEGNAVVNITSPKGAEIEYMTQLSEQDKFNVSYDAKSGNVYVAIANVKGLKVNSTYSVNMKVVPVGNGAGAKAQTYTIRVKVTR